MRKYKVQSTKCKAAEGIVGKQQVGRIVGK